MLREAILHQTTQVQLRDTLLSNLARYFRIRLVPMQPSGQVGNLLHDANWERQYQRATDGHSWTLLGIWNW